MLNLSPNDAASLLAAANAPEDSPMRKHLASILGGFEPIPGRHWTSFPIVSVVAFLLWISGHQKQALEAALQAVAAHGADDLTHTIRVQLHNSAMLALHQRRPDLARMLLAVSTTRFAGVFDGAAEKSLLEMIDYVEGMRTPAPPRSAPVGRPTVISLGVWGESFIKEAATIYLPCCLAEGNLPGLRKHGTTYLRIHTRAEDIERLTALPVLRELAAHVQLEIEAIPAHLLKGATLATSGFWNRLLYAAIQYSDVMFARSIGADFMIGVADLLMSDRCYTTAKRHLMAGHDAVVLQMSRVSVKTLHLLEGMGARQGNKIDVSSEALYQASLEGMHGFIVESFMRRNPGMLPVDPVHFYFTAKGGFSHRSLQLNPFAFSANRLPADLKCDFHTLDAKLLSDVLAGRDRDSACYVQRQMLGEMYAVSVDDDAGVASFGNFELSPAGAANSIVKWANQPEDIDHFQWAVRQRFEYPLPPDIRLDLPADCRDEEEAVNEIVALLESRRAEITNTIQAYRQQPER